jgi:hypothetical protein
MLFPSNSTDRLLNSFPMFGHPGISALEYAGQMDRMKEESTRVSDVSLKRKSTTPSRHNENAAAPATAGAERECEVSPPVHFIDEFGCQQRRRGTFINHTPRNFEMRSSKPVDVYRPSTRAESENYSRPLSRQSSMASGSPAIASQHGQSPSASSGTFGNLSSINSAVAELDSTEVGFASSPEVYMPSTKNHRRSLSAPLSKILTYEAGAANSAGHPSRGPSLRSTSLSDHPPQEPKRQRRQTPFKLVASQQINIPRHAPLEPWVAEHRRKGKCDRIGDVPYDMDREVSAEIGTFGVIQRYFDSQGGGPVLTPKSVPDAQPPSPPNIPLPVSSEVSHPKRAMEPIAIYPIDELGLPDQPPPVPDRSPKRFTNPAFPLHTKSKISTDSDFQIAAEGAYSPYDRDEDELHEPKKRTQARLVVGQPRAASANGGRLAPTILGHDAQVASSDLRLDQLAYFLRNTGPSQPSPPPSSSTRKKKRMGLFKVKQRKSLAARVGSVEGSPQRARTRPVIPVCAREMTTSGGARHLRIIIPTESPHASQVIQLPVPKQRRSRHISISFTEEMLNPLASPDVERIISTFDTPARSVSTPAPKSPRSPKRAPRAVPVSDHPLASRDEQTRARKLRDLQRIKRKPVPVSEQKRGDTKGGALPTPAHTPEPATTHEEESVEEDSAKDEMAQLQSTVAALQRQNKQLAEALKMIVGLDIGGEGEEVLEAFWKGRGASVGNGGVRVG